MKKKFLSVLLSLAMLLTLVPAALAADLSDDQKDALEAALLGLSFPLGKFTWVGSQGLPGLSPCLCGKSSRGYGTDLCQLLESGLWTCIKWVRRVIAVALAINHTGTS